MQHEAQTYETVSTPTDPLNNREFARLPKPGGRLYGLSRTTINELCLTRTIRSSVLRKKGARRSIRLIHLDSLRDYIMTHAEGGEGEAV